ncbi:MAG: hypothetical protein Q9159_007194 [Coniocarpon cinnabarinum]
MPRVGSNLLTSPTSNPSGSSFPLSDPLSSTTGLPDALLPPASHDNTTNDLDFNRDPTLATSFPATSRSISNVSRDRLNVLTNSISPHALSTTSLLTPSGSAASSISSSSTSLITPAAPAMISPKDHISFDTLTRTCTDLQQLQKQLEENRSHTDLLSDGEYSLDRFRPILSTFENAGKVVIAVADALLTRGDGGAAPELNQALLALTIAIAHKLLDITVLLANNDAAGVLWAARMLLLRRLDYHLTEIRVALMYVGRYSRPLADSAQEIINRVLKLHEVIGKAELSNSGANL